MACSGENDGPEPKQLHLQEAERPITIAISSELFYEGEESAGPANNFVQALKTVNDELRNLYPGSEELFRVKLINGKSDTFNELITPLCVTSEDIVEKLQQNNCCLYLSAQPKFMVEEAIARGIPAAVMLPPDNISQVSETELRVVFDGDAVLFSNESESVFQTEGLTGYLDNEKQKVNEPMNQGPLRGFAEALGRLQKKFYAKNKTCLIHTYLLTSRDAGNAGYRALNTLKTWGLEINEGYFLSGSEKVPLLNIIRPHIFFDDQESHIRAALQNGVVACQVP